MNELCKVIAECQIWIGQNPGTGTEGKVANTMSIKNEFPPTEEERSQGRIVEVQSRNMTISLPGTCGYAYCSHILA